jgi:hypothetical protein
MNHFEEEQEAQDDNNFKVYVRVRPLLPREILNGSSFSIVRSKLIAGRRQVLEQDPSHLRAHEF